MDILCDVYRKLGTLPYTQMSVISSSDILDQKIKSMMESKAKTPCT